MNSCFYFGKGCEHTVFFRMSKDLILKKAAMKRSLYMVTCSQAVVFILRASHVLSSCQKQRKGTVNWNVALLVDSFNELNQQCKEAVNFSEECFLSLVFLLRYRPVIAASGS